MSRSAVLVPGIGLLVLGALLTAFPDYFTRFRNGEPLVDDAAQPGIARLGRVIGIALLACAAILLVHAF